MPIKETVIKKSLIITIVLVLGFVFITVGYIFSILSSDDQSKLLLEIAKGLVTLALVAVVGGGIKWLYDETTNEKRNKEKEYVEELARKAAKKERQKQYYDTLINTFATVSEQFSTIATWSGRTESQRYQERMEVLTELRPKLVRLYYSLEITPALFAKHNEIEKHIQEAISFFDCLLEEFARQQKNYGPTTWPDDIPLADFPEYAKFEKNKLGEKVSDILTQIASEMSYDILDSK